MDINTINFQTTVGSYVGMAFPRSQNTTRQREFCKQKFSSSGNRSFGGIPNLMVSRINRGLSVVANRMRGREERENSPPRIQEIFELAGVQEIFPCGISIDAPDFVRLFSNNDIDVNSKGYLLKNPLGGEIDLTLNPSLSQQGSVEIVKALQQNLIKLELKSFVNIWRVKMFNTTHHHFPKYVTGLGLPNFQNHLATDGHIIIKDNRVVLSLTEQMEKVKQLYSLMFSGFCLKALCTTKPVGFIKRKYFIQKALRYMIPNNYPNKNAVLYTLVWEIPIQFAINETTKHEIKFLIACDVFRIKVLEGNQTSNRSLLNLASTYPIGNEARTKFSLWANDLKTSIQIPEADQIKFNFMKEYMGANSFLTALKMIYPNLKNDIQKQNEIKQDLISIGFDQQIVDEIMQEIMTWPNP